MEMVKQPDNWRGLGSGFELDSCGGGCVKTGEEEKLFTLVGG